MHLTCSLWQLAKLNLLCQNVLLIPWVLLIMYHWQLWYNYCYGPLPHQINATYNACACQLQLHYLNLYMFSMLYVLAPLNYCACCPSSWSEHLQPDPGKKDSHHFECHLVSRLPQVLLLHCVPLHPRWLHQCHPACRQWHLPHSDLSPARHHLQDWSGGCEEGRQNRQTESKGYGKIRYWKWGVLFTEVFTENMGGRDCVNCVTHNLTSTVCTTPTCTDATIIPKTVSTAFPSRPGPYSEPAGEPTYYVDMINSTPSIKYSSEKIGQCTVISGYCDMRMRPV